MSTMNSVPRPVSRPSPWSEITSEEPGTKISPMRSIASGGIWIHTPLHPMIDLINYAPRITMPVRFTFGDHERMWPIDDESLRELRGLFTASRRVETFVQPDAGQEAGF